MNKAVWADLNVPVVPGSCNTGFKLNSLNSFLASIVNAIQEDILVFSDLCYGSSQGILYHLK